MPASQSLFAPQAFDPADCTITTGRRLPHWSQSGAVCFITWRTADSLPADVARRICAERDEWPLTHPNNSRSERQRQVYRLWSQVLDRGLGSCPLRDPACSKIVADSLRHFDGTRYLLFDFVVMPNHVHVLAAFQDGDAMRSQCESWKKFTAGAINRRLGRAGRLWQSESFDHLVRSDAQLRRLRRYVAANPARAGLADGESVYYSAPLPEFAS